MMMSTAELDLPAPPDVKAQVSKNSELTLLFTQEMVFPPDLAERLDPVSSDSIEIVFVTASENEDSDSTLLKWSVTQVEASKITIDLVF